MTAAVAVKALSSFLGEHAKPERLQHKVFGKWSFLRYEIAMILPPLNMRPVERRPPRFRSLCVSRARH
jgi:hypothetical protein